MKFSEILYKHNKSKTALISDGTEYTYGRLISDIEQSKKYCEGLVTICAETIYDELIGFLSCETGVPVIVPPNMQVSGTINPRADFAITSSGSSGTPKLLFRTTESWYNFFDEQNRVFNITENTILFMNGSLCFSGNLNIILGALHAGAAVVIDKGHLTGTKAENIRKCNAVYLIPDKLRLLCRLLRHKNKKFSAKNIETVIAGSQSMGRREADLLQQLLGAKCVILYYGAAEISYISYIDILSEFKDRSCIGKPFNGVDVQFRNERLTVSSDFSALGTQMPYMINDIIHEDSDGFLYYDGRYDDVLNIGGEKISASALENELMRAEGVEDVCVFLKESLSGRNILCCAWCGQPEAENELRRICIPYTPKKWYRLACMPKNSNGKTDRNEVIRLC